MPAVICTALNSETGPHFEILQAQGFQVDVVDRRLNLYDPATLVSAVQGYAAILAGSENYSASTIRQLPGLRVFARSGVGYDAIHMPTCDELGIVLATTPGVNHLSVAEHTIAFLMALGRGFPARDQTVRQGTWIRVSHPRIAGQTLGLVGLGRIGFAVALKARGLGLKVIAHDPLANPASVAEAGVELVSMDDLFARADFLSLHCPATKETTKLIRAETIAKMKRGAIVINTARGALIDEPALIDALKSGRLGAAGLDVFDVEPLPSSSPLLSLPNVLLSNHVAGLDHESQFDTVKMAAETIVALHSGGWPTPCIRNLAGVTHWKW